MSGILGNMRIGSKLLLLVAVPLAAIVVMSFLELGSRWQLKTEMQRMQRIVEIATNAGELIHALQIERGYSAGYVSSRGEKFGSERKAAVVETDKRMAPFEEDRIAELFGQDGTLAQIRGALEGLGRLPGLRSEVAERNLTGIEVVDRYSSIVNGLLGTVQSLLASADNGAIVKLGTAYAALLQGKEYAGQERAILSNIFGAGTMSAEQFLRWQNVLIRQDQLFDIFNKYAARDMRDAFTSLLQDVNPGVLTWRELVFGAMGQAEVSGDAAEWFRDATARIEGLKKIENSMVQALSSTAQSLGEHARQAFLSILALVVGALVVTGLLAAAIIRSITRPVSQTVGFAQAVAAGDLERELKIHQGDEIGKLCDSLRAMVQALREKIGEAEEKTAEAAQEAERARQATMEAEEARAQAERARREGMTQAAAKIEGVVERLGSASQQLSSQVDSSAEGARVQKDRIAETATAMEEMNSTVLEVARNAANAAQSAESARQEALAGADVVRNVVEAIGKVQRQALSLKENMGKLAVSADDIGKIMSVINDIADQTNLLALNAAIEAARAGEAGRGFAVVADEVRKLAEKTMVATREVEQAIHGIQSATQVNAQSVDESVDITEKATTLANDSGNTLERIVRLVGETSDQVSSIAAASEEQSAASEEINRAISEVNTISDQTAERMDESASAVTDLAEQARELQRLVEVMAEG